MKQIPNKNINLNYFFKEMIKKTKYHVLKIIIIIWVLAIKKD